ncbi:unnamed protein product [Lymnaea stagnalis]|uniref:5'-AMP-activated protein kinase subunit beta-1 n=1 Tax=Lymnaea stagnalis TaxID=6523 RepID=A0AAV2HQ69_LYMST
MGAKSSKQKSKKNKNEEGENGEAEGQPQEPTTEHKEGDASTEKKTEENGTVVKENDKAEEGDKKEESKEVPVAETVATPTESAPVACALPTLSTQEAAPSEPTLPVSSEVKEPKEENSADVAKEDQTAEEIPADDKVVQENPVEAVAAQQEEIVSQCVSEEPAASGESVAPVETPTLDERVEPSDAEENFVQEESLPQEELPPPPPTPAEPENAVQSESVDVQPEQGNGEEGDSTPAAPFDTAESGAATSEVDGSAEAGETAAPSEEQITDLLQHAGKSRPSEGHGLEKNKNTSKLAKTLNSARALFPLLSSKRNIDQSPSTVGTEFKWEDGGDTVLVSGTFNNWEENIPLSKNGDVFSKTLDLPLGEYLYRFLVDEQWQVNKSLPIKCDENGLESNLIVVKPIS